MVPTLSPVNLSPGLPTVVPFPPVLFVHPKTGSYTSPAWLPPPLTVDPPEDFEDVPVLVLEVDELLLDVLLVDGACGLVV